ncbi:kinase-like domain-containing protein [Hyaloraphidium curvatum]|nr:kinase-like domain-containing protein [Hyaloraphidium curvatum]
MKLKGVKTVGMHWTLPPELAEEDLCCFPELSWREVVDIYSIFSCPSIDYIASESRDVVLLFKKYVHDLRTKLRNENPSYRQRVDYARQIVEAVARMHAKGIMHRDLKIDNVLEDDDGSLAITGFGAPSINDCTVRQIYGMIMAICGPPSAAFIDWANETNPGAEMISVDLLESMLEIDPSKRISAAAALRHPFFTTAPAVEAPTPNAGPQSEHADALPGLRTMPF